MFIKFVSYFCHFIFYLLKIYLCMCVQACLYVHHGPLEARLKSPGTGVKAGCELLDKVLGTEPGLLQQ